ncbi:MAG TPA: inositol monophosphatase family protein [Holophagaceae bacterium]|nr:inositol monophosphatase family protein [Holophagaceae bacterium]
MFEAQRDAAVEAAKAGGAVLMGHWRRLDPATVQEKTKNDLVSIADKESEAAIHAVLEQAFPQYGWLGEETGVAGDTERKWIVDPLDGTLNFIQGFPQWCVSIALWDAAGPAVGVVWDPLKQDLFVATRGDGATWNGRPIQVSAHPGLDGAFLATGFAYQLGERFPRWRESLDRIWPRAKAIRRAGSAALDLAHTAAGIYDGFWEMGLQPWDLGAGVLLVSEAGGLLSDWEGGETWTTTGNLLAGAPGVQQGLVATLR